MWHTPPVTGAAAAAGRVIIGGTRALLAHYTALLAHYYTALHRTTRHRKPVRDFPLEMIGEMWKCIKVSSFYCYCIDTECLAFQMTGICESLSIFSPHLTIH